MRYMKSHELKGSPGRAKEKEKAKLSKKKRKRKSHAKTTATPKKKREGRATPGSLRKLPDSIHQRAVDLLPRMSKAQKDFTLSVLACTQVSDKQKQVLQEILKKVAIS